jgi:hypothetical protein
MVDDELKKAYKEAADLILVWASRDSKTTKNLLRISGIPGEV